MTNETLMTDDDERRDHINAMPPGTGRCPGCGEQKNVALGEVCDVCVAEMIARDPDLNGLARDYPPI